MTGPKTDSFPKFEASMHRCLANASFVDRFYARFMLAHPEIAERFAKTDLKKQERILRGSLYLMLRAASGHQDGLAHLDEIGRTHTARNLGIRPHHFDLWLDALVQVASEIDGAFDETTAAAWRENLAPSLRAIVRTATTSEI